MYDRAFPDDVVAGPFESVAALNDWFSMLYRRHLADPTAYPADPYRKGLPDECSINITHGDLHPSNILVSRSGSPRILALIDWEQAGWLPEYWEVRKVVLSAKIGSEWLTRFIPMFLDPGQEATWHAWEFYVSANGV